MRLVLEDHSHLLNPCQHRFSCIDEDSFDTLKGWGATEANAVADFLINVSDEDLEEYRFAAAAWGDNRHWLPEIEQEIAERRSDDQ